MCNAICNGRVIVTGIILSVVYVILSVCTHGYLLKDLYMQTATIWRPEADMTQLMWLMTVGHVIFAFVFAGIFAAGFDRAKATFGQGFRFGLWMAFLIAPAAALTWYVVLPIPSELAFAWFAADFIQMLILGLVVGLVYRPSKS